MKNKLLPTLLLVLSLNPFVSGQEPSSTTGDVVTKYDRFKDATDILMRPVTIIPLQNLEGHSGWVDLAVFFTSPGQTIVRPKTILIFLKAIRQNAFRNRYPKDTMTCPATLAEFFDLRDRVFLERKSAILESMKRNGLSLKVGLG